jgi:hypothetical protein
MLPSRLAREGPRESEWVGVRYSGPSANAADAAVFQQVAPHLGGVVFCSDLIDVFTGRSDADE